MAKRFTLMLEDMELGAREEFDAPSFGRRFDREEDSFRGEMNPEDEFADEYLEDELPPEEGEEEGPDEMLIGKMMDFFTTLDPENIPEEMVDAYEEIMGMIEAGEDGDPSLEGEDEEEDSEEIPEDGEEDSEDEDDEDKKEKKDVKKESVKKKFSTLI
jgi:hypothetical protein